MLPVRDSSREIDSLTGRAYIFMVISNSLSKELSAFTLRYGAAETVLICKADSSLGRVFSRDGIQDVRDMEYPLLPSREHS
jgi:hypothetical protein